MLPLESNGMCNMTHLAIDDREMHPITMRSIAGEERDALAHAVYKRSAISVLSHSPSCSAHNQVWLGMSSRISVFVPFTSLLIVIPSGVQQ